MNPGQRHVSSAAFFEAMYEKEADPWEFSSKPSELERYDAIIGALSHRRYRRAFEPGCSIGVLTERLAALCDFVEAIDFSQTATARAKGRCARLANVEVVCTSLPDRLPVSGFDLIVLSEIGYYSIAAEWEALSFDLVDAMPSGGIVLAAHWLGESKDHCISGDRVHNILLSHPKLHLEYSERHPGFRLDRLVRA